MNFKKFDYMKHRNKFFLFSTILVLVGIVSLFTFGLNLGIDFTKGTRIDIRSDHAITVSQVKDELAKLDIKAEEITPAGNDNKMVSVRLNEVFNQKEIAKVQDQLKKDFGVKPSISTVSPQVGRELAKNAFFAILIASVCIIIYVTIRFEFLQGVAAIIALLHDAFFIITVFSLLHIEVNIIFIAAVLTIVGYSINDTIVTFDRIRENMRLVKRTPKTIGELGSVVNTGIQQTIVRSVNTVMTVLLPVIALLIFGSASIWTFTLAMLIGLLCGTYSSICIASPLWAVMKAGYNKSQAKKKKAPQPQS